MEVKTQKTLEKSKFRELEKCKNFIKKQKTKSKNCQKLKRKLEIKIGKIGKIKMSFGDSKYWKFRQRFKRKIKVKLKLWNQTKLN